jgi:hypothetical protein
VDLGWLLAELYDSRKLPGPPRNAGSRPLPPHLPGIGKMTPHESACALAAQAGADLVRLGTALGTELPTAENIQSWAGVRATLGRVVRQAEHAMWEAEVVTAIGKAATVSPGKQGSDPGPEMDDEPEPAASLPSAAGGWPGS